MFSVKLRNLLNVSDKGNALSLPPMHYVEMGTIISCKPITIESNTQIHVFIRIINVVVCMYFVDHNNNVRLYRMACNLLHYSVADPKTKEEGGDFTNDETKQTVNMKSSKK